MSTHDETDWRPSQSRGSATVAQIGHLRRTGGPLNHAVYDLLKERLLDGHYPAGTHDYQPTNYASSSA